MTVDEAAEWIYFMAVKNRFCTGQNILIDGLEAGNCNFNFIFAVICCQQDILFPAIFLRE